MDAITHLTRMHGGLIATYELHAAGYGRASIRRAVEVGTLIRVRKGWYASPGLPTPILRAARVGGRITCLSAMSLHGIWAYPCTALHVAVSADASRLRRPTSIMRRLEVGDDVRVHWRLPRSDARLILSPGDSLADLLRCQPPDIAATAVDSALHRGVVGPQEMERVFAGLSERRRALLHPHDGRCESGTETIVRVRMALLGIHLRPQVLIPGVGRVDFVAGDRLVIEVDGAEYHTDPVRFETDRRRDAELSRRGYRVLRFSYRMVMDDWPLVESAILSALFRGDHH